MDTYPRETQEMVFDAHDRAFALFKGTCQRGIYDNIKTAVAAILVGKDRLYNRRFLQMCSHYLVDPVACTPASGWEKGQVENQVGLDRLTHHCDIVETGNDSWRFKNRDDDQKNRARAVSAPPAGSDGANATAKTRRSKGSLLEADTGSRSNAD